MRVEVVQEVMEFDVDEPRRNMRNRTGISKDKDKKKKKKNSVRVISETH